MEDKQLNLDQLRSELEGDSMEGWSGKLSVTVVAVGGCHLEITSVELSDGLVYLTTRPSRNPALLEKMQTSEKTVWSAIKTQIKTMEAVLSILSADVQSKIKNVWLDPDGTRLENVFYDLNWIANAIRGLVQQVRNYNTVKAGSQPGTDKSEQHRIWQAFLDQLSIKDSEDLFRFCQMALDSQQLLEEGYTKKEKSK